MKDLVKDLNTKQYIPVSRIIIVIFLVFLIVLVGKGVTGFSTSLIKLQEQVSNSTQATATVKELQQQTQQCTQTLNNTSIMFSSCRQQLETIKSINSHLISQTSSQQNNITTYTNEISTLNSNVFYLTQLTNNLAINICCLRRYVLDDPTFKYYYIKDNKTYCLKDPNDVLNTKPFSC